MKINKILLPLLASTICVPFVAVQCSKEKPDNKTDNNNNQEKIDSPTTNKQTEEAKTSVITTIKSVASMNTPIKTIMTTLKENFPAMQQAVVKKFSNENDIPYELTEFMEFIKNIITLDINQMGDDIPKYMIPGSHGSTFTKQSLVNKLNNIFLANLQ
ncbi:hypothetical protein [Mycoplasma sp. Z463D]